MFFFLHEVFSLTYKWIFLHLLWFRAFLFVQIKHRTFYFVSDWYIIHLMQIYFLFHLYYRCFFFLFQCFMGNNFNIQQFCFPHILIIHRFLAVHICIHNYIVIMNNHCNNINFDLVGKILVFVYLSDCMNIMVVVPCKSPSHQICMAVVPF